MATANNPYETPESAPFSHQRFSAPGQCSRCSTLACKRRRRSGRNPVPLPCSQVDDRAFDPAATMAAQLQLRLPITEQHTHRRAAIALAADCIALGRARIGMKTQPPVIAFEGPNTITRASVSVVATTGVCSADGRLVASSFRQFAIPFIMLSRV